MNDKPIGFRINEVGRMFRETVKAIAGQKGISGTYFQILGYLFRNNDTEITQSDICSFIRMKPSTISVTLKNMEKEELIERRKSSSDCRKTYVSLGTKGNVLLGEMHNMFIETDNILLNSVTPAELESFYACLDKMRNAMLERMK